MRKKIEEFMSAREFYPKIYSLVLESAHRHLFVWSGVAYSLEEALGAARRDVVSYIGTKEEFWRLFIFNILEFKEIGAQLLVYFQQNENAKKQKLGKGGEIKEQKIGEEKSKEFRLGKNMAKKMLPISPKSKLMEEIIKKKDESLYKKNENSFTSAEKMLLSDKLKRGRSNLKPK